jgi:hypothetical protein
MKSKLKAAIKRTRAKLHNAKSDAKSRMPGAAERVSHHGQALQKLTSTAAPTATTHKAR